MKNYHYHWYHQTTVLILVIMGKKFQCLVNFKQNPLFNRVRLISFHSPCSEDISYQLILSSYFVFEITVFFHVYIDCACYFLGTILLTFVSVGWSRRIHRLHLCRMVRVPNECSEYEIKQSGAEVRGMLKLWGMRSTLHCDCSQIHSGPEWLYLIGSYLSVK